MNRKPHDHTAKAPDGSKEWSKVACVVTGCGIALVWVRASGHKAARWQHVRS